MIHDLPCTTSEKSTPIPNFKPTNSCLKDDGQSFELQPLNKPKSPKQGNSILRPITQEILKDYLAKEKEFNFSSYNQKRAQIQTRRDASMV